MPRLLASLGLFFARVLLGLLVRAVWIGEWVGLRVDEVFALKVSGAGRRGRRTCAGHLRRSWLLENATGGKV